MLKKQGKQLVVGRWQLLALARADDARDGVALRALRYWLAVAAGKDCAPECWLDPMDIEVLRKVGLGKHLEKRKPADARMSHNRRTPVFGGGR